MPAGVYPNFVTVERFMATVAAGAITTPLRAWVAPVDLEVVGVTMSVSAAPGGTGGVVLNIQNTPSSQLANTGVAPNPNVAAYNLWTTANAPSILGAGTLYPSMPAAYPTIITPQAYAQNYPFPGPAGTVGYTTAQSQTSTTSNPVLAPPNSYRFGPNLMVQPDNTYTDYNNVVAPASIVHAGDVLLFNVAAGGSGNSVGSAANLEVVLLLVKR